VALDCLVATLLAMTTLGTSLRARASRAKQSRATRRGVGHIFVAGSLARRRAAYSRKGRGSDCSERGQECRLKLCRGMRSRHHSAETSRLSSKPCDYYAECAYMVYAPWPMQRWRNSMSTASELKRRAGPRMQVRAAPSDRSPSGGEPVRLILVPPSPRRVADAFEVARLLVRGRQSTISRKAARHSSRRQPSPTTIS
jgi:hypothetical protein